MSKQEEYQESRMWAIHENSTKNEQSRILAILDVEIKDRENFIAFMKGKPNSLSAHSEIIALQSLRKKIIKGAKHND